MKWYALLLALLLSLRCSGIPLYSSELESMADRGLGAALAEVNSRYAVSHLYRVTRASVTRVIPMDLNTVDLLIMFGIKETECAKASRSDLQTCAFRPGFFVVYGNVGHCGDPVSGFWPSFSCSSRVKMSTTSAQVVSLRCGHDSSSSSESSEEMFSRGRYQFNNPSANRHRAPPAPPPTPPPVQSGRSLHSQAGEVQPRGDTFSNFLV